MFNQYSFCLFIFFGFDDPFGFILGHFAFFTGNIGLVAFTSLGIRGLLLLLGFLDLA